MSLITGAGRSGLDPIAKWSLILAPIAFIVGGFVFTILFILCVALVVGLVLSNSGN